MEGDDESWRDIDPPPLFSAADLRPTPRVKRIKIEPDTNVEPDIEAQGLRPEVEQAPEPSSPSSSEVSYPPSPDASCPPSPAASCSSPPEASCPASPKKSRASSPEPPNVEVEEAEDENTPEASCDSSPESSRPPSPDDSHASLPETANVKFEEAEDENTPESSCPSSPEDSHASSPEPPDIKLEEEEDEHTPEAACESSPESSCPSWPELPEIKTEVPDPPKCRYCKETAVLMYTSFLNEHNADRPYFVCPRGSCRQWVCWADQEGIGTGNPRCDCKDQAPSRLDIIVRNKTKFGRGFWTCARGQCDFYSENERGKPGVSFEGGFYPRGRDGKRKYCD